MTMTGAYGQRSRSTDPATVIAAGVLAATLATVCHETLGHGLGCVVDRGQITLLTSIWFRCKGAMSVTDAGGPIGSLVVGTAAMTLLSYGTLGRVPRLFALLFGGLSLFWFASQLITHPLGNRDDWFFVARRMGWPWVWRPIMMGIGVGCYVIVMRWTAAVVRKQGAPGWRAIWLAYVAAAVSAVIAGLMWQPEPIRSAIEETWILGVAPLGLLIATRRPGQAAERDLAATAVPRSWAWIAVSVVVFGVFLFVQARGVGSMAGSPLPR